MAVKGYIQAVMEWIRMICHVEVGTSHSKRKHMMSKVSMKRASRAKFGQRVLQGVASTIIAAAAAQFAGAAPPGVSTRAPEAIESKTKWSDVEALVTNELQQIVDRQRRIEGQAKLVKVQAKLDQTQQLLTINLSRGYVPKYNGGEFEDLQSELTNAALDLVLPAMTVKTIDFRFDGKPITSFFPEDAPPPRQVKKK